MEEVKLALFLEGERELRARALWLGQNRNREN